MLDEYSMRKLKSYGHKMHPLWMAFLLTACGGGSSKTTGDGGTPTEPGIPTSPGGLSGRVVDGYVANARVFLDANNNKLFDAVEEYSITNSEGVFSGLNEASTHTLVVDNYAGTARDTSTGFGLGFTMAAPTGYEVITPVTTLVVGLMERGKTQADSEAIVTSTLGLTADFDLSSFDPFENLLTESAASGERSSAEAYQLAAMKVANIMLVRDGDYTNTVDRDFQSFLDKFARAIEQKYNSGETFNFSDVSDLRLVVNEISNKQVIELANSNSATSYRDLLDDQLISLSGTSDGSIDVQSGATEQLVAVEIDGTFNAADGYSLTITGEDGSVVSADVVSFGNNVAVFRFTKAQLDELGSGSISVSVKNISTGEILTPTTQIEAIQPATTTSTGGGTGSDTPAVVVSDDGIVADGYISGARVFRDENENETYDIGENFVLTDASGAFTGLGGSADKPIVADGNGGAAIDTSTGVTFTAVLSAPAGSKVVNPITTVVNELMQDTDPATIASITNSDGKIDPKLASDKVAKAFGLSSTDSFAIDLTKYDPIANKVYVEEGAPAQTVSANLATVTQGVAAFIANIVVSGANEQGGSADDLLATKKSIIGNIKEVVKAKASSDTAFKFDDQNDILSALGSNFSASSPALEKLKTSYAGFEPAVLQADNSTLTADQKAKLGSFDGDNLIAKQLLSQSEFGDGILTTAEASNGATLVVGPTSTAQSTSVTVKITNDDRNISVFKQVEFSNAKYASVSLTADDLTKLGGGTISVEVKDAASLTSANWASTSANRIYDNFSDKAYFHKDITPVLKFGDKVFKTIANDKVTLNKSDTKSLDVLGTLEIDLGGASLPTGVTLKNLVGGLGTVDNDAGRKVNIEVLDASGKLAFLAEGTVAPVTDATNASSATGKGIFKWSATIDGTDTSAHDDAVTFASLDDGQYSVRVSFADAYGTVSSASGATFSNLTIDRELPTVSISASDVLVNVVDGGTTFKVVFSKAISLENIDYTLINIELADDSEKTLADEITDGDAAALLSSDGKTLSVTYTPAAASKGEVDLKVLQNAITDASGNANGEDVSTASTVNSVSYDLVAPTLPEANIKLYAADDGTKASVAKVFDGNRTDLKVEFKFTEDVKNFTLDDVTITSISGSDALALSNLTQSTDSAAVYTADVVGLDQAEGNFKISVASGSYSDAAGNVGSAGVSANLTIDTRAPKPFQVFMDKEALAKDGVTKIVDKTTYENGDKIVINVVFDQPLNPVVNTEEGTRTPTILLDIGGASRAATHSSVSGSTAKFTYTVTNSDNGAGSGIGVASEIVLTDGSGNIIQSGSSAKLADNILAADDSNGAADENTASVDIGAVSQPINLGNKRVDGGDTGATVDGYIDGGIIYADNDLSSSLTSGDALAQADATGGFTIYGANGPLILEDGFDISTNKEFAVRYKAPYEAGTDSYQVINPITTLVAYKIAAEKQSNPSYDLASGEAAIHSAIGSPLSAASVLRRYNAYEEIAKVVDASGIKTNYVEVTVDAALAYQQVAASVALVVDFLSTAAYHARAEGVTTSIKDVSDAVFEAVTENLTTFMSAFVGQTLSPFYDGTQAVDLSANIGLWDGSGATIYDALSTIASSVTTKMDANLATTFGGVTNLLDDFPEALELLSASIVAINLSETDFVYPALATVDTDTLIEAAEAGITALTEIVQVQSLVQADILGDIAAYYAPALAQDASAAKPKPTNINVSGLLGADEASGYLGQSVGTVVPIRYDVALAPGTAPTQFESGSDGVASEFNFLVTRAGSIKTTSTLDYAIEGNISAADIAGGQLSGQLVFDVNEKTKIVNVRLNNDTIREGDETITLVISDPTETSQIVQDRASATVRDDDPSSPEIALGRVSYATTEDGTVSIDDASVDYFDLDADFKLEWNAGVGTLSTKLTDGTAYTSGAYVSYFDLQNGLLQNLEYLAENQPPNGTSDFATLTITAVDDKDNIVRSASESFDITFDISRTPTITIDLGSGISYDSATSYAGTATKVSGITISDADSEFVSVNVSADLAGKIDTTSTASFNLARNAAGMVTIAGDKASVQDALDNLTFTATRAGDVKLTISIDDGDLAHSRGADGSLAQTTNKEMSFTQATAHTIAASSPVLSQTFEPNLKVGADFWNAFTGLSVSDADTQSLTLTLTSPDDNARFRLYDVENVATPIIRDAATSLQLAGTASDINTLLTYLQVELTSNADGSVLATLSDGDTTDSAPLLTYVAMDNAVPDPGGDRTASSTVTEDAGAQAIVVEDIRLYDADAFEDGTPLAPTQVKILGAVGGTVSRSDGSSVLDGDGVPATITLEAGTLNLSFNPDADFFGEGKISYVVVDPQQPTFTSAVSEITVNVDGVNDKPAVKLSSAPVNFTQGQAPVNIFNNASVVDIDNALGYTSIKVEIIGGDASDALITPTESFSVTPTAVGNTVTFSGVDNEGAPIYLSASEVSALLASIKYENSENFFASTQRTINVTVTDDEGLESDAASVGLTLTDINDAPALGGGTSQLPYEEGGSPLAVSGFGSLSDPEGTAIRSVKIEFASGYSPGSDILSYSGAAVSANFDEATGALTLEARDLAAGLTAADFNDVLADVSFSNVSDNPSTLSKKLVISATDVGGATGTSALKEIVITPVNDAPSVVSVVGGIESLSAFGGLYIKSGSPVKVAPTLRVKDADSLSFSSAKVEITTVPGSEVTSNLSLSALGENLKSIYGLTITPNDPDNATALDITKSSPTISKTVLESVLREVSYENDGTGLTGKVEDIKISVVDAAGTSSNVFTSSLNLLDTPPIEVHTVSGFDTSAETPSDYYIATRSVSEVKELKLNVDVTGGVSTRLFEATQLTVDLSSSTIRTEAGRFVYDRAKTTDANKLNKLSDAQHVDVSELAGGVATNTNIIGSATNNVIQGSDFADFIDGLGGRDVVRAGGGDDTVILRMSQNDAGAVYDGGTGGGDTLVLPNLVWNGAQTVKFAGTVDLIDTSVSFTSYGVTVSNFENIDGGSATAGLTLKGNASANTLRGGSASDTIWIGGGGDVVAGGALVDTKSKSSHTATDSQTSFKATYDVGYVEVYLDGVRLAPSDYKADSGTTVVLNTAASTGSIVEIIPIDDVFAIDLSSLPESGSTIGDLSRHDRIKLSIDGTNFLDFNEVNWIHTPEDIEAAKTDTFSADKLDAWIEQDASGYRLTVETAQDAYKYVSIGTELYGTKGKWAVSDGDTFMLKPTLNVAPEFKSTGPASTAANPLSLSKADGETVFAKSFTGGDLIAIREPADGDDGDKLTLTFTSVGGVTLKSNLDDTEGLDEIIEGDAFDNLTPSDVNGILSDLVVEMSSRGRGDVEFTISDGFAPEISKTLFLQAPNTAPTVSTTFDPGTPPVAEIGGSLSLSSASLSATIGDIDAADTELLTATLKVTGGLATVPANYANYVTVNGGTIRVAYDGTSDLAGKTWPQVLAEAVEAISFSRATLGDVDVKLSVADGLGATTTAVNDIKFTFAAKDLPAPTLIISSRGEAGLSSEINATQFDTGKVRVSVTDVGAKPGDKVVFKTTVDGTPQPDFDVTIPASASNPNVVANFVEVTLPNLAGSGVTGGVFSVTAVLEVGGSEITPKGTPMPATFTLDTSRPDAPVIKELSDVNGPTEVVTNTSVTKLLVSDPEKDAGVLSHALVKLNGVSGAEWYDFSGSFDIKSLLQGDGVYLDEIAVTSSKKENPDTSVDYELTVSSQLEDGIYAVIARDSVENVSAWDVSGFSLDGLAPELFVVDRTLDGSNIGFRLLNAGAQAGDDYELFKLSAEQSKAVEFAILPNEIGTDLPTDLAGVKIEVWSGSQSGAADIVAEFERDFSATSAHWSKVDAQAIHSSVSAKSAETLPVFVLDFASGLTVGTDQVSVKITAEDRAGNTFEVTVPSDQIQIDATADVDGPEGLLRTTVADDIFTGISAAESSTFSAKVEGLDTDISARTTYLLTDAQFAANLKLAKDAAAQSLQAQDGQTEFVFNEFDAGSVEITLGELGELGYTLLTSSDYTVAADGKTVTLNAAAAADQVLSLTAKAGGQFLGDLAALEPDEGAFFEADGSGHLKFNSGAVYLDISDAFLESLYLTGNPASKAPTSGVGSKFSDWILVGTSGGKAQYITFDDYLSYDPETTDLATLDVYLSEYVVDTALDDFGRLALETISEIDLLPIFPALGEDDYMVVLTEVSDVAGNVAFGGNIFNQNLDAAVTPSEVLLLDNTPPDAPSFIVERSDGGIDFWEAQQTITARITPVAEGDSVDTASARFDGELVQYKADENLFSFDIPRTLAPGIYDLTVELTDSSGNTKTHAESVELNRDALDFFSVVPSLRTEGADVVAQFDIYLNTNDVYLDARALDFTVTVPTGDFAYQSFQISPNFGGTYMAEVNDLGASSDGDSGEIRLSAVAYNGFAPAAGSDNEPVLSIIMNANSSKDTSELIGQFTIFNAFVDEEPIDFDNVGYDYQLVYAINMSDIILPGELSLAGDLTA